MENREKTKSEHEKPRKNREKPRLNLRNQGNTGKPRQNRGIQEVGAKQINLANTAKFLLINLHTKY